MLTFQELLLFSDKVLKKETQHNMTREVEMKWAQKINLEKVTFV